MEFMPKESERGLERVGRFQRTRHCFCRQKGVMEAMEDRVKMGKMAAKERGDRMQQSIVMPL